MGWEYWPLMLLLSKPLKKHVKVFKNVTLCPSQGGTAIAAHHLLQKIYNGSFIPMQLQTSFVSLLSWLLFPIHSGSILSLAGIMIGQRIPPSRGIFVKAWGLIVISRSSVNFNFNAISPSWNWTDQCKKTTSEAIFSDDGVMLLWRHYFLKIFLKRNYNIVLGWLFTGVLM